jgi:hypothetical protein
MNPDLKWYKEQSTKYGLTPRCPFAHIKRCYRYYASSSMLGEAKVLSKKDEEGDKRLLEWWNKSDICATSKTEDVGITFEGDKPRHYANLCPEIAYLAFDLFASDLYRFSDDIDRREMHRVLVKEAAFPNDWRWTWAYVKPTHYTDCSLYSLLREGISFEALGTVIVENKEKFGNANDEQETIVQGVENDKPVFIHSDDFKWVKSKGEEFELTDPQAKVLQYFYEQRQKGILSLHQRDVCARFSKIKSDRLRDIFKSNPNAFGALFETKKSGWYRLKI